MTPNTSTRCDGTYFIYSNANCVHCGKHISAHIRNWHTSSIPIPGVVIPPNPSKKDRLKRQIERLRHLEDALTFHDQLDQIIPVLEDLALDL